MSEVDKQNEIEESKKKSPSTMQKFIVGALVFAAVSAMFETYQKNQALDRAEEFKAKKTEVVIDSFNIATAALHLPLKLSEGFYLTEQKIDKDLIIRFIFRIEGMTKEEIEERNSEDAKTQFLKDYCATKSWKDLESSGITNVFFTYKDEKGNTLYTYLVNSPTCKAISRSSGPRGIFGFDESHLPAVPKDLPVMPPGTPIPTSDFSRHHNSP